MTSEEAEVLRGTTLKVYRFLLKRDKPTGVREIQRALNLSSPSLAAYHLSKLEEAGLLRREKGDYIVNKVFLESMIRIRRTLIPRHLFYSVFTVSALIMELTFLKPYTLTSAYFFSTTVTLISALAFCYETAKTWIKGGL
jgi:DNA-binding MarR family transcriptional regulator